MQLVARQCECVGVAVAQQRECCIRKLGADERRVLRQALQRQRGGVALHDRNTDAAAIDIGDAPDRRTGRHQVRVVKLKDRRRKIDLRRARRLEPEECNLAAARFHACDGERRRRQFQHLHCDTQALRHRANERERHKSGSQPAQPAAGMVVDILRQEQRQSDSAVPDDICDAWISLPWRCSERYGHSCYHSPVTTTVKELHRSAPHDAATLKAALTDAARAEGFDVVGRDAARCDSAGARAVAAVPRRRRHGDMDWMETTAARRGDPRALWPDVRSVIMLGMNYGPDARSARDPATPRPRRDLGLCAGRRLSRDHQAAAEGARALADGDRRRRRESVRRHRRRDGEAAGRSRPASAGRASTPTWCRANSARGCSSARSSPRSNCRRTRRRPITAAVAAPASTSARPRRFPRPTGSMRGAASPTSPSSTKARSRARFAR